MLWLNYFISNKYQVYNTVQYIQFIMKLELERNRKLIELFCYYSVHYAMEGGLIMSKVSNGAKIRNRYNQVPHLTQDTNGKVTNSQKTPQTRAKRSALSQQVTTKHI